MVIFSGVVYKFWIGNEVVVPFRLSIGMALFVIFRTFNSPFSSFMNGIGKIRVTLYIYLFLGVINIPLSLFFAKYLNFGVSGVILATAVCFFLSGAILSIQYCKLTKQKAKGLWLQ
jgi:Na+-driven multidrug efflux pump